MRLLIAPVVAAVLVLAVAGPVAAHAPGVVPTGNESPSTPWVLDDPTLSRALGATLEAPGETDWYRMDLRAGDALVVEVTAPDATGGIPVGFTLRRARGPRWPGLRRLGRDPDDRARRRHLLDRGDGR